MDYKYLTKLSQTIVVENVDQEERAGKTFIRISKTKTLPVPPSKDHTYNFLSKKRKQPASSSDDRNINSFPVAGTIQRSDIIWEEATNAWEYSVTVSLSPPLLFNYIEDCINDGWKVEYCAVKGAKAHPDALIQFVRERQ